MGQHARKRLRSESQLHVLVMLTSSTAWTALPESEERLLAAQVRPRAQWEVVSVVSANNGR